MPVAACAGAQGKRRDDEGKQTAGDAEKNERRVDAVQARLWPQALAAGGAADGCAQFCRGRGVEQVADGTGAQGGEDFFVLPGGGEHDYVPGGLGGFEAARRFDSAEAGQAEIHQLDVGRAGACGLDRGAPLADRGNDGEIGRERAQHAPPLAEQRPIVHPQPPQFFFIRKSPRAAPSRPRRDPRPAPVPRAGRGARAGR